MLGSSWILGGSTSGDEDFRENIQEIEHRLEFEFSIINWWFFFWGFDDDKFRLCFDIVSLDQRSFSGSHNTESNFFLKFNAQSLVDKWESLLLSEEESFGNWGIFGDESVDIGRCDFNNIVVNISRSLFQEIWNI